MDAEPMYLNAHADEEREQRRLRNLEAWHDRATIRRSSSKKATSGCSS